MKAKFPHVLEVNDNTGRLVAPSLNVGDVFDYYSFNNVKVECTVIEIIEQRPAKGDWSGWGVHPFYFKVIIEKNTK